MKRQTNIDTVNYFRLVSAIIISLTIGLLIGLNYGIGSNTQEQINQYEN